MAKTPVVKDTSKTDVEAGKSIVDTEYEITVNGKAINFGVAGESEPFISAVSTLNRVLDGEIRGLKFGKLTQTEIEETDVWLTVKGDSAYIKLEDDTPLMLCPVSHLKELLSSQRTKVVLGKFE